MNAWKNQLFFGDNLEILRGTPGSAVTGRTTRQI